MSKRSRIIKSVLLILVLITSVNLNAISFYVPQSGRPEPPELKKIPVPKADFAKTIAHPDIPVNFHETEYIQKAAACLRELADTGAAAEAVTRAQVLMNELYGSTRPFAETILQVLNHTVALLDGEKWNADSVLPRFANLEEAGISPDIIFRAMAACYERSKMNPNHIVLTFAGDCTFGAINGRDREVGFPKLYHKSGSVSYPFDNMKPWFFNDDLTVVNCEGTLTTESRTADKQWKFRGLPEYAAIFPAGSVEVAGLANNHAFDYLEAGFEQTKTNLQGEGVGVFYSEAPYITEIKGVQVVIIGDSTVKGENVTVKDGVAERVIQQIINYKKTDNIVAVVMHWGGELNTVPTKWQQETARRFIDAGSDIVAGHHPHVVQGIELYNGRYIVYSLGNFAFGGNPLTKYPATFAFRIQFAPDAAGIKMIGSAIVPCYTTSSIRRINSRLQNNFQPRPLFGQAAEQVIDLVLERSSSLRNGISDIEYFRIDN